MKLESIIGKEWHEVLKPAFNHYKFKEASKFLSDSVKQKKQIFPELKSLFRPFSECPYRDLKVVILNDAPFEDERANDGLAFSVSNRHADVPKDAIAFLEGIEQDVKDGFELHKEYDLSRLAKQGVLLLNSSLTVEKDADGKWVHHHHIWNQFIKEVLTSITSNNTGIIFIFVGVKDFAKLSQPIIHSQNYILTCINPAEANHFAQVWNPSHVFQLTNGLLKANKNEQIKW